MINIIWHTTKPLWLHSRFHQIHSITSTNSQKKKKFFFLPFCLVSNQKAKGITTYIKKLNTTNTYLTLVKGYIKESNSRQHNSLESQPTNWTIKILGCFFFWIIISSLDSWFYPRGRNQAKQSSYISGILDHQLIT